MRRVVSLLLLATVAAACSDASDTATAPTPPPETSADAEATSPPDATPSSPVEAPATSSPTTVVDGGSQGETADSDLVVPEGFDRVRAVVTEPDGTECELCLWLADDADRRRRGLMFVTDLGPADGMAFVYPGLHTGTFWMKDTLLPLSIAFFGPTGAYLDSFDMEPCTADPCGQYPTPSDFVVAIETTQGGLPELGIVPGSVLDLTDLPCEDTPTDTAAG